MFRRTRPRAPGLFNQEPTLCSRHVGKRLCARPATWHVIFPDPQSRTGFSWSTLCDKHRGGNTRGIVDSHPLAPICLDPASVWNMSQGGRPGFCFFPHEEEALHEELSALTHQETR